MDKLVKEYLDNSRNKELEKRDEFLVKEGLYEDIYSTSKDKLEEFPLCDEEGNWYRREIAKVTDEEFEKILEAKRKSQSEKDSIGTILNVFGWLYIIFFFIAGIVVASYTESYGVWIFLLYLILGIFSSVFIFGFARIINLLHQINNKKN